MPEPDVLTIDALAALPHVGLETAHTLTQIGQVPGFQLGGPWRFRRRDIEAWIDDRTRLAQKGAER